MQDCHRTKVLNSHIGGTLKSHFISFEMYVETYTFVPCEIRTNLKVQKGFGLDRFCYR